MAGNNQFLIISFSSRRERIEVTEVGRRCEKHVRFGTPGTGVTIERFRFSGTTPLQTKKYVIIPASSYEHLVKDSI